MGGGRVRRAWFSGGGDTNEGVRIKRLVYLIEIVAALAVSLGSRAGT